MLEVYHETLGNLQIVIDSDDWSQFKIAAGTPLIGYTKPFYEPRSPGPTTNEIFEGHVSFGTPVVTTAKEEGMIIPRSLMQRGDVYIVRFAAPLRCQLTVSTKTSGDGTMVIEASSP